MSPVLRRFIGLCLPPLALATLDGALTLAGQSAAYWSGERVVNEAAPLHNYTLSVGPAAFIGTLVLCMVATVVLILLLPDTLALVVSLAGTFAHTFGASTWIIWRVQHWYQVNNALPLTAAVVAALGIRWTCRAESHEEYRLPIPAAWRYTIAAVLFLAGLYLSLWPQ